MRYKIEHTTTYKYTDQIELGPHIIKLTPKNAIHLFVHHFYLNIDPKPFYIYQIEESDGSSAFIAYFSEKTDQFKIEHTSEVTLEKINPFNFLIMPEAFTKVPFYIDFNLMPDLFSYAKGHSISEELKSFVEKIAMEQNYSTIPFTMKLCSSFAELINYQKRNLGKAKSSNETFESKSGSCRDIALLFIDSCRYMGIPGRFVSGYLINEEENCDLHAWVDLYLPGGGWISFDPSSGVLLNGNHVPLVASSKPTLTLPISGNYFGTAESKLDYNVKITVL